MRKAGRGPSSDSRSFAPLRMTILWGVATTVVLSLLSCSQPADRNTLVMIIESSPTNLDPRVGLDAQSERIDELLFDALLTRDEHLNVQPGLAERWETPDPLTYIFHLHHGVTFHDGRPLTSRDFLVGTNRGLADVFVYVKSGLAKWTFEAPTERVRFEHRGGQLYPRVAGAQTNQPLTIYNADPIPHLLRSHATNLLNQRVEKTSPPRDLGNYFTTVRHPEVFYRLQCDAHAWETAYVAVVPHPFFAVSDANGFFTITNHN